MNIFMRCKLWDVIFFPFCSFIPFIHLSLPSLSLGFSAFTHSFVHSLFFHSFLLHIHDEREWNGRIAESPLRNQSWWQVMKRLKDQTLWRISSRRNTFRGKEEKNERFFPCCFFFPSTEFFLSHLTLFSSLSFDSLLFFGRNIKARFRPLRGDWVKFPSRSKGRESKKQREKRSGKAGDSKIVAKRSHFCIR